MEHHVFISHSSSDAAIANAICHYLEADGIRCWIAPRDIRSSDWAGSIMKGIQQSDVFVVIISHNSIPSPEVIKEVTEATRVCRYILPFKVDQEMLNDRLRYHLAPCHWLDAVNPPLERHIEALKARIHNLSQEDAIYANKKCQKIVGITVKPKNFFVGRENEIRQIHEMLEEEPVLFLQGMGGIGKSEIAKGYASTYADSYDTVLFANYRGSIRDMIIGDDITIENLNRVTAYGEDAESDEAFFKRKLRALKEFSDSRTLLIVDNFDVDWDEHLEDLVSGPYRLLFTSRYEHYDYPCLPIGPIQDFEKVRQLFSRNYGRPLASRDKDTVDEILKLVSCHTITVELIAKQMRASFTPPQKMLELLRESGTNAHLKESVKRGAQGKSAFDFIKDLFHISALSDEEKYIMKCMCLVPVSGIEADRLAEYLELDSLDVVNELLSKSWLMFDEETCRLQLHPIICDVTRDQLSPDQTGCQQYIRGLWKGMGNTWFLSWEEKAARWPYVDHVLKHYGTPTAELWQEYSDFANIAWICGQFTQSIEASKRVYEFTLNTFGDAGYKPAFAARCVAGAYFNAGQDKNAEPYYYLSLEHMRKAPEEDYVELGFIYQKVGRCAYTNGDFDKATEYLNASLESFEKAKDYPHTKDKLTVITPGDTYVSFERMYMLKGDYVTALEYCRKSYDLFYSWKNCDITNSAYSLSDMGICHSSLGEYEKAADCLQKALELNMRFNGEASMVTVRTKESIADNLARQGKLQEAKSAYLALEMDLERDFGSECPQVARLREKGAALDSGTPTRILTYA